MYLYDMMAPCPVCQHEFGLHLSAEEDELGPFAAPCEECGCEAITEEPAMDADALRAAGQQEFSVE